MSKVTAIAHTMRTDARNILASGSRASGAGQTGQHSAAPREFAVSDKSLIRKLHGFMPAEQLLRVLNERLLSNLGSGAVPYTMEQLHAEIGEAVTVPAGGHDWASLRKLLATARDEGVLASISEQVIDDFAVVFSLNAKQVLRLKDILLHNNEEDEA